MGRRQIHALPRASGSRESEVAKHKEVTDGAGHLLAKRGEQGFVMYDDTAAAYPAPMESVEEADTALVALVEPRIELRPSEQNVMREMAEPQGGGDEAYADAPCDQEARFAGVGMDAPTDLYFREIGQVPLLQAGEEIALAKRIEAGRHAQERLDHNGLASEERVEMERGVSFLDLIRR